MNNVWIADNIYQVTLDEITSVVNVEDQKEIATYVVNDLINRFNLWEKHIYHLVVKLNRNDNIKFMNIMFIKYHR